MSGTFGIVAFAVLILFAIGFHEFGHFITARWSGIKVSRFFIGFGPTIWSFRGGRREKIVAADGTITTQPETEYGIKALPLGGFVKVVGMSPFEEIAPRDEPRSFRAAPAWKRAVVLAAGSATHFITAFLVLVVMFSVLGVPDVDRPTQRIEAIEQQIDGEPSPAVAAGLEPGDEIVALDGRPISSFDQLREIVSASPGQKIVLTVRDEGGVERTTSITPAAVPDGNGERGLIGIAPGYETRRINPISSVQLSAKEMGGIFTQIFSGLPEAFSPSRLGIGEDGPSNERGVSIIGAGRIAGDLAATGQILLFLFLFVNINMFIGVFNLFPIPPLDGGHLLFLAIEKVRGKPVNERAMVGVTMAFTSVLVLLMVVLVYLDIVSPVRLPGN